MPKKCILKVENVSKLVKDNPGITNHYVAEHYGLNADYVGQWFNNLDMEKNPWLFIQLKNRQKFYFDFLYAKKYNIPSLIGGVPKISSIRKRRALDARKLDKLYWPAPKGLR